jgi:hypothetical protein
MRIHGSFRIVMIAGATLALAACVQRQVEVATGAVELGPRWMAVLTPPGVTDGLGIARDTVAGRDTAARAMAAADTTARQGQLTPTPAASLRVGGSASMVAGDIGSQSRAAVAIFGGAPGAVYTWHVHAGRCGDDRGILGQATDYPPITVGQDGRGEAVALVSSATPTAGDYFVNIHASASDLQTIVACGNLARR